MKQFTGGVPTLTKQNSASTARLESTAPVNVKQNPNNVNMGGTIKTDGTTERNLMHTERVRANEFDPKQNNQRNTLAPSPSVPTFKKEDTKRSFTPRNDKEKTLENTRPNTQTQLPNKQVKSSAHSVYDPNLKEGKGGPAVEKGPDVWVRKWVD